MKVSCLLGALCTLVLSVSANAAIITYTDEASFLAALPGPASTLNFDSTAAGTLIPTGNSLDGVTFTYSISGLDMKVVNVFDTTTPTNYFGLDDLGNYDLLIAGDTFTITFDNPVSAFGIYFISGDPLVAGDIILATPVGTASNSATIDRSMPDGGVAYYIGLISEQSFTSVDIQFSPDAVETFLYDVDDISFSYTADVDIDTDGVFDNTDNCTLKPNGPNTFPVGDSRIQLDTDGDGYGNLCDGDLNNDGSTNTLDLNLYKQVHRTSVGDANYDVDADFNGDGQINTLDLNIYKGLHRKPPGPSCCGLF